MGDSLLLAVHADGHLRLEDETLRCALGRGGIVHDKREGDGATPVGRHPLRAVLFRPDRGPAPETRLPVSPLSPADGWCDDPGDPAYNRPVRLPFAASHERMWRDDGLYDLVVVLGYNDDPVRPGAGSAIFMHVASPDYGPTEGCIALSPEDLRRVLRRCSTGSLIEVLP